MIRLHWQTFLFALAGFGIVVLHAVMQPALPAQVLILAPLVAVLGLPHGALDLPIAEALWPLTGWRRKLLFIALYLGLAGSVIALWLLLPGAALAIFLLYSALHFSGDWMRASPLLRWSGGAATIGAPALLHHGEVEAIFAVLAPQDAASVIADAAALVGALALAGGVLSGLLVPTGARGGGAGAGDSVDHRRRSATADVFRGLFLRPAFGSAFHGNDACEPGCAAFDGGGRHAVGDGDRRRSYGSALRIDRAGRRFARPAHPHRVHRSCGADCATHDTCRSLSWKGPSGGSTKVRPHTG